MAMVGRLLFHRLVGKNLSRPPRVHHSRLIRLRPRLATRHRRFRGPMAAELWWNHDVVTLPILKSEVMFQGRQ